MKQYKQAHLDYNTLMITRRTNIFSPTIFEYMVKEINNDPGYS